MVAVVAAEVEGAAVAEPAPSRRADEGVGVGEGEGEGVWMAKGTSSS